MSGILNVVLASNSAKIPDTPTNLSATASGDRQVTITFTTPTDNGGAIDYYSIYLNGSASVYQTYSTATSPVYVTGLSSGNSYTFQLAAHNSIGDGPKSAATSSPVIAYGKPGTPTNVSAVASNSGQVTISFTPPNDNGSTIDYYIIDIYINGSYVGTQTYNSAVSPVYATGLTNGQAYTFQLSAHNAAGGGTTTTPTSSVTVYTITAPAAPTVTSVTQSSHTAYIYFTAGASNNGTITAYEGYSGGTYYTASGTSSPVSISGLTDGQSYNFYLRAYNSAGWSTLSSGYVTVTPLTGTLSTPSVSWSADTSFLTWEWPNVANCSGYYYRLNYGAWISLPSGNQNLSISITTSATLEVYAYGSASWASSSVYTSSVSISAPSAPTGISASYINGSSAYVYFSVPGSTGGAPITSYKVFANGSGSAAATGSSSPIQVSSLTYGGTYTFTVSAVNSAGVQSTTSSSSSSLTLPTAPSTPSSLSVSQTSSGQVQISFSVSANGAPISYINVYLNGSTSVYQTIYTSSSPVTVTGLTAGQSYTFQVSAYNAAGIGTTSSSSGSITIVAAPSSASLSSSGVTSSGYTLSISYSGSAPSSYSLVEYNSSFNSQLASYGPQGSNSFAISSKSESTTYYYVGWATNVAGSAQTSNFSVSTISALQVPGTVSIYWSNMTSSTINIQFSTSSGGAVATWYLYRMSSNSISNPSLYSQTSLSSIQVTVTGGQQYYLAAVASNAAGTSANWSNILSFIPVDRPGITTLTASGLTYNQVTITSSTTSGGTPSKYFIYSSPTYNSWASLTAISTDWPLSYVSISLSPSSTYYFTGYASNDAGNSTNYAPFIIVTTPAAPTPTIAITAPTSSTTDIAWDSSPHQTSASFEVTCSLAAGYVSIQETQRPTGGSTSTSYPTTYYTPGGHDIITVYATSPSGAYSNTQYTYSWQVSITGGNSVSYTHTQNRVYALSNVTLSYSSLSSTQVYVYISSYGAGTGTSWSLYSYPGYTYMTNNGSYGWWISLTAGQSYGYIVYVSNSVSSAWSTSVSFTAPAAASVPTTPTYSISGLTTNAYTITLSGSTGANYYYLYDTTGGGYTSLGYVSVGGSFGISGKSPGTTQSYQGYATNGTGSSGTVSFSVTTLSPTFTTINANGSTSGNTFGTMWGYTFACTITGSYQFDGSISGTAAADSYMYLYDASGSSILTSDDDSGPDASSLFTYTCNAGTSYIVKIRDYYSASATAYLTITKP